MERTFLDQYWLSEEISRFQLKYHQQCQMRALQKYIKPCITLRLNPHFYLEKNICLTYWYMRGG